MRIIITNSYNEVELTFNEFLDVMNFINMNKEFIKDCLEQDNFGITITD